jgi:DNA recombination protein RmuC
VNEFLLYLIAAASVASVAIAIVLLLSRKGDAGDARALREELAAGADRTSQSLVTQMTSIATVQNNQIDGFSRQLAELTAANERRLQELRETVDVKLREAKDDARLGREETSAALQRFIGTLNERFGEIRQTVETRLESLQKDNAEKLEKMRATVDEKLHETLEKRLGESFKQVADRLEQVHKGLGEMQSLAADVGGLKQVLSNVKTLGLAGEMQLGALLEQALAPEQYARNVVTRPKSRDPVEFAVRLPGREGQGQVWLPIDSKFPITDYQSLLQAQEAGDVVAAHAAAKALEQRVRLEARSIRDKYVEPPATTDFAILFVPTEGLYAEILRRPGLFQQLQHEFKVTICGPVNLIAFLNSLQMGFRTLAIEKRSSEVWEVLGAVKTEFENFGRVLASTKRQLETVTHSIEQAETRTRQMSRKLKSVEALPEPETQKLLGGVPDEPLPGG